VEEGQGYTLRVVSDPDPPRYVVRVEVVRPVEDEPFPLVLGDFLQNARAALDHIAGALGDVGASGVMSESDALATMFPITRRRGLRWSLPSTRTSPASSLSREMRTGNSSTSSNVVEHGADTL
jgi:hypothetical protein